MSKWTEALRSGEYQQATGSLKKDSSYCCLGVACDVYRKETGRGEWKQDEDGDWYFSFAGSDYAEEPPEEVMNYFGFDTVNGVITGGDYKSYYSLIEVNDSNKHNFHDIADLIDSGVIE